MLKCTPTCHQTASIHNGRRLMVSQGGKYPFGMVHEQCGPCALQDCAEAMEQIARQFPDSEEALLVRFEKAKRKL